MATLTLQKSGKTVGYNIQWYEGKIRRTVYLGGSRYSRKTAERFKEIVETLIYYRRNNIVTPDKQTEHWLRSAPKELQAKLAKAGLLAVTAPKTCQELWDTYLKYKTDVKRSTITAYHICRKVFFEMFFPDEPVKQITAERLLDWKALLLDRYAPATVAGHIKVAKTIFRWAVEQEWITKNPMRNMPTGSFRNRTMTE
jgi:hypothetical protein